MRLTSLFTGNPHFVNLFALTTLGIGIPMVYLHYTAPTEDEKERRSIERIPDQRAAQKRVAEFGKFLQVSDSKEMDDIYTDLLRGGSSSPAKRRQAVYGRLGAAEQAQKEAKLVQQYGLDADTDDAADASNEPATPIPTV